MYICYLHECKPNSDLSRRQRITASRRVKLTKLTTTKLTNYYLPLFNLHQITKD